MSAQSPIVTPPGWKRWCPTCRSEVVAYRDHDLTCLFCDGPTRSIWAEHGTSGRYSNHGCRCEPCCTAHRDRMRRYRAQLRAMPVPDHVHGTTNGYQNYGCRCDACLTEGRGYDAAKRRAETGKPRTGHGATGYKRGCRCRYCRAAHANERRAERARKREAAA